MRGENKENAAEESGGGKEKGGDEAKSERKLYSLEEGERLHGHGADDEQFERTEVLAARADGSMGTDQKSSGSNYRPRRQAGGWRRGGPKSDSRYSCGSGSNRSSKSEKKKLGGSGWRRW